ncbi:MAG: branched-chain amino acid aminotransferase [Alphaproteobacteria bacterium]|nr:branched-chain amino acid aminotransferase [Alphaproteobacteria bacterium]
MSDRICYVNGAFVPESEAKISVFDRGFTSGEGVYEVTRSFGHEPFRLREHLDRLYRSLRYTRLDCGITQPEMDKLSREVFAKNVRALEKHQDHALWHVISRGIQTPHVPGHGKTTVVMFCVPVDAAGFARDYVDGVPLVVPSTRRIPVQSLDPKAKVTNKVNHLLAAHEARQVDPKAVPLMLDTDGNISETHLSNFCFITGKTIYTPSERGVLGGITKMTIVELADMLGLDLLQGNYSPYDVYNADEAFICSTSFSILPARSLDGIAIGHGVPGPWTVRLIEAWSELVRVDIVDQAIQHLPAEDARRYRDRWHEARRRN